MIYIRILKLLLLLCSIATAIGYIFIGDIEFLIICIGSILVMQNMGNQI